MAEEDKKAREKVEAKNTLENYVYSIRNAINDKEKLGGKLDEEKKEKVEKTINEAIEWIDENAATATKEELDAKYKEIESELQPILGSAYGGAQGGPQGGEGGYGGDEEMPSHDEL